MFTEEDLLSAVLDSYLLTHDLAESTGVYYGGVVTAVATWHGRCPTVGEFTADFVSRFLLDKQRAGKSSYYRKSLRNGLRALLGHVLGDKVGKVRAVKLDRLTPESWTAEDVGRLLAAVESLHEVRRGYWRTLIQAAFYTGLSQCDLHRLQRADIRPDGIIRFSRSKTGAVAIVSVPAALLVELHQRPSAGPLWPLATSREMFRRTFGRLVRAAGLRGTFKKLRKTCGTLVELANPGRGHEVLANSRQIFERHYLDSEKAIVIPLRPRDLPSGG